MINDEIEITRTINKIQKDEILSIMYDTFEKKLSNSELKPKSREQGLRILRKSANYDQGLYAVNKSEIIGAVGMNCRKKKFYYFQWKVLLEEFCFIGALWRSIIQKISADRLKDTELYIGSIAVAEHYRGKGIGTQPLDAVNDLARKKD